MIMNLLIFVAGLAIQALTGWVGLAYLAAATVISYILGLLIPKKKWLMWPGVAVNALILLYIKLLPVTNWGFIEVLGISYFSLQIIAYLVDVYKGKYPPQRNFLRYALYIMYLPHLFTGADTQNIQHNQRQGQHNGKKTHQPHTKQSLLVFLLQAVVHQNDAGDKKQNRQNH